MVHFDNDVLIYKSFAEIEKTVNEEKINITSYNNKKLIFGYSYIKNSKLSDPLSKKVLEEYQRENISKWKSNNGKPLNEMEIMKKVNLKILICLIYFLLSHIKTK